MSLATRCTACGTIFRVVQDQLKVSEGWVRCGRCDAVFNAMEGLFDLQRDVPPAWPAALQSAAHEPSAHPHRNDDALARTPAQMFEANQEHDHPSESARSGEFSGFAEPAGTALESGERYMEFEPAQAPSSAREPTETRLSELQSSDSVLSVTPGEPETLLPVTQGTVFTDFLASEQNSASPDFIRHSDEARRRKRSGTRIVLAVTATLALLVLGMQLTYQFRDSIAAHWPQSKPALVSVCTWVPCQVSLPRRIDDLAVENTALAHTIPGSDAFKLSVSLRNRGSLTVALPSVDLSLTDAAGQLVARRALSPSDFQAGSSGLSAGSDTTLSLMLAAGDNKVTGYTVELFYP